MDIADRIEKRRRAKRLLDERPRLSDAKAIQAFVMMEVYSKWICNRQRAGL
jgi:hypothetical protein